MHPCTSELLRTLCSIVQLLYIWYYHNFSTLSNTNKFYGRSAYSTKSTSSALSVRMCINTRLHSSTTTLRKYIFMQLYFRYHPIFPCLRYFLSQAGINDYTWCITIAAFKTIFLIHCAMLCHVFSRSYFLINKGRLLCSKNIALF